MGDALSRRSFLGVLTGGAVAALLPTTTLAARPQVGVWWPSQFRVDRWFRDPGVDFVVVPGDLAAYRTPLAGRPVIAAYNAAYRAVPGVGGWFNKPDEPDAAAGARRGPYPPSQYAANAAAIRSGDRRPVWGSIGQSMANLNYEGRGPDVGKVEPLIAYCQPLDVVSWFVYPGSFPRGSAQSRRFVPMNFDLVRQGMVRARQVAPGKPIYFTVEAARIYDYRTPTRAEIVSEARLALDNGAAGIIFFPHKVVNGFVQDWGLSNAGCLGAMRDIVAMTRR